MFRGMRRERFRRLQAQLEVQEVDGFVLLRSSSVAYATVARQHPPRMVTTRRCFARWRLW